MNKLTEYLNEYRKEKGERNLNEFEVSQTLDSLNYLRLFIKWLVDNDKIDRKKLEIRPFSDELVYSDSDCTVYRSDTTYEMLLMLLAISDTPIDDLISYLK